MSSSDTLLRTVVVTLAGAIVVVAGRSATQVESASLVLVVVVAVALILAQQLVMNSRSVGLVTAPATAILSFFIANGVADGVGVEAAFATVGVLLVGAICKFIDEVPFGAIGLVPWALLASSNSTELVSPPIIATSVGLTAALLLVHRPEGSTPASPPIVTAAVAPEPEITPADPVTAVVADDVDFSSPSDEGGLETEVADEIFATLNDGNSPTVAIPQVPAGTPEANLFAESMAARSEKLPAPSVGGFDSSDFHLMLGQPSRADGTPGELAVMPNPFTAGSESDNFTAGNWVVQARSSRGSSHVHGGEPRQDSYALTKSENGNYLIVAISDGLGSAKRSNFGSYWSTRLATAILAKQLDDSADVAETLRALPSAIATQMSKLASSLIGAEGSDIAATLVIAVVPTDAPAPVWLARVGDSDAMVLTQTNEWASGFGGGEPTALETGTTFVLPHHPDRVEVRTIDGSKARALLIATDGVSRVIETSPDLVGAAFAEHLGDPVGSIDFQRVVDFRRRGAHDDRTAVALWHRSQDGAR